MLINCIDLEKLGYTKEKARDILGQLCLYNQYTFKQQYIDVVRNAKRFTMLQTLRCVDRDVVLQMCDEKIKRSNTNRRINKAQWEELKNKLCNLKSASA